METLLNVSQIVEPDVRKALDLADASGIADKEELNTFLEYLVQNRGTMTDDEVLREVIGHMCVTFCD